jgi:hypothetical protein
MDIIERCKDYLSSGGLFDPDLVNHDKVRDLIIDCRDEIKRLRKNAEQDARYLSAYHRICQKHGIAPSSSDLIAAMEECDERAN